MYKQFCVYVATLTDKQVIINQGFLQYYSTYMMH